MSNRLLPLLLSLTLFSPRLVGAPLMGHKMMVATPSPLSAQIAEEIIGKKGNVVDVAVAIALVLSVTNPRHAALGGGGFAMIKMGKSPVKALDFREVAPKSFSEDYYLKKDKMASRKGPHAIGVPGIPAGLWALHKRYGKLHWSVLFDEPIKLASKGFPITGENSMRLKSVYKDFNEAGKKHFLINGRPPLPGEVVKQKALSKALKLMRNRGITPFYHGQVGRDIVETIRGLGGTMTRDDLREYKVRWLEPIEKNYKGHKIYLMPPPSSGGLIISASLSMLDELKTDKLPPMSTQEFHHFAEVMKINFRNRNLLGDPDFVKNPTGEFLDKKKISQWVAQIEPEKLLKLSPINSQEFRESPQTTHFSVLDAEGNAVSMTITLNNVFGSKVVSNKYGIALNNEMDDFTTRLGEANSYSLTQGVNNKVQAGKRPLSSMSPTLVEKGGKIVAALGAPGGPRIITGVLMTLYRMLAQDYNIEEAIHAPRVHHQYNPDILFIDGKKLPPLSIEALEKIGHKVQPSWHSIVNGVRRTKEGILEAGFDYRAEGGAGGN